MKANLLKSAGRIWLALSIGAIALPDQDIQRERELAIEMLERISADMAKHYYDPKYHGVDWPANIRAAKQRIEKADGLNKGMSEVAAALGELNDSHTFLLPPQRPFRHDYGWQIQMFGDRCFVTQVRPGSDAEGKGVKPGDQVLGINGYEVTRDSLHKMEYVFNILRPQAGLHVSLLDPGGRQRDTDVMAKMTQLKRVTDLTHGNDIWELIRGMESEDHLTRVREVELEDDLMIAKIPEFLLTEGEVGSIIGKARKHKSLILDLRGNPGGAVDSLKYLIAGTFENDVKIGDHVGREGSKPLMAKAHGHPFTGKLVVLVDSKSASAAELFARVVQIEKRGVVVGDHSSGSVMEARRYTYKSGADTVVFFGASITDADLIMGDGKSLEHTGVTPDVLMLPTAADLAGGRDPVMARAAEQLGAKLSAEQAGKMFPYEWAKK